MLSSALMNCEDFSGRLLNFRLRSRSRGPGTSSCETRFVLFFSLPLSSSCPPSPSFCSFIFFTLFSNLVVSFSSPEALAIFEGTLTRVVKSMAFLERLHWITLRNPDCLGMRTEKIVVVFVEVLWGPAEHRCGDRRSVFIVSRCHREKSWSVVFVVISFRLEEVLLRLFEILLPSPTFLCFFKFFHWGKRRELDIVFYSLWDPTRAFEALYFRKIFVVAQVVAVRWTGPLSRAMCHDALKHRFFKK